LYSEYAIRGTGYSRRDDFLDSINLKSSDVEHYLLPTIAGRITYYAPGDKCRLEVMF
jgi:hypothetical protein